MHHWIEPRVRAHVFLCMLAYYMDYMEWHLGEAGASILFHDLDRQAALRDRASPIASADISDVAKPTPL